MTTAVVDPFTTVGRHEPRHDEYSLWGRVTVLVDGTDVFSLAVRQLVKQRLDIRPVCAGPWPIYMTTESCWSGYSEFTITNEWSEIVVSVPSHNLRFRWDSVGAFLTELAAANPAEERY